MNIEIRHDSGGSWIALYKDGKKEWEGHGCDIRTGLWALDIEFNDVEVEVDDCGCHAEDGTVAFPDELS